MFGLQEGLTVALISAILFMGIVNDKQRDKIDALEAKLAYERAMKDANKTRLDMFENNITKIKKDYYESIDRINHTPIGDTFDFGL